MALRSRSARRGHRCPARVGADASRRCRRGGRETPRRADRPGPAGRRRGTAHRDPAGRPRGRFGHPTAVAVSGRCARPARRHRLLRSSNGCRGGCTRRRAGNARTRPGSDRRGTRCTPLDRVRRPGGTRTHRPTRPRRSGIHHARSGARRRRPAHRDDGRSTDPRAEIAAEIAEYARHRYPDSIPQRAVRILDSADQVAAILTVAGRGGGLRAGSATTLDARESALRPLWTAVRHARVGAVDAALRAPQHG